MTGTFTINFQVGNQLMFADEKHRESPVAIVIAKWDDVAVGRNNVLPNGPFYAIRRLPSANFGREEEFLNDQEFMEEMYTIWIPTPKKHWKATFGSTLFGSVIFTARGDAATEEEFRAKLAEKYIWTVEEDLG